MGCNSSSPATAVQAPKKAKESEQPKEQNPTAAANALTKTANITRDNSLPKIAGNRNSFLLQQNSTSTMDTCQNMMCF